MNFNLVVIGSGLSSLSFIDAYLEQNTKIDVISPDFTTANTSNCSINSHLFNDKNLPPQMKYNLNKVKNYFYYNNFIVNKNSNVMGSLEFGGLSNYWGLQIDHNISKDIECLSKKNSKKLKESFFEIAKKIKFLGQFNLNKKSFKNDFIVDNFFDKLLRKKINYFKISKPILAISSSGLVSKKRATKKIDLNSINEHTNNITARNYYKKFLKNKNINFHNYVVQRIFFENNKYTLVCLNQNKKKIFYAKKIVFGCGTLVTTKLILDFLNIKKEIKIKEHPRLISLFFSKHEIKNNLDFMPSQIQIRNDSSSKSFMIDFRPGNKSIIDTAIKIYKLLFPFKILLNFIRNYMIFSNILLDSRCSNLFMKLKKESQVFIYSKNKNTESIFKKIHKKIFNFLISEKLIYPIYKNFFSGNGSAYHYFGTIPITKNKKKLSVNHFCQLKGFKNIYIIDGSVFDFKKNKYPLGIIMANARRIGKEIKR